MKRREISVLVMACLSIALLATACNKAASSSPSATMKAFFETTRKKDVEGFKKTLSKGTLDMMEESAKQRGKSLDEILKTGMDLPETVASSATPEMRNEKISGDRATLEVQNDKNKEWETMPFVKENGEWKIALDQAIKEAQQKAFSSEGVK